MLQQSAVVVKAVHLPQPLIDGLRAVYGSNLTLPMLLIKAAETVTQTAAPVSCFVGAGQPEHAEYYQLAFDCEAELRKLNFPVKEPLDLPEMAAAMRASGVTPAELRAAIDWLFRADDPAEGYFTANTRKFWKGQIIAGRPMLSKANWQKLVSNVLNASGASMADVPARNAVSPKQPESTEDLKQQHEEHLIELAEQAAEEERCRVELGYSAEDWAGLRPPQRAELYLAWKQDSVPLNPAMADALQQSFGVRPLDTLLALYKPHCMPLVLLDDPIDQDAKKAAALRAVEEWEAEHGEAA